LRVELEILLKESSSAISTSDESSQVVKKLPKFGDIKVTKNGIIFFLKAGKYQ